MQGLAVYLAVLAASFALSFVFKRRFGVLGLGLAVGMILSEIWTDTIINLARVNGIVIESYGPMMVPVLLVLAPVLILFFKGYSCRPFLFRLIGSALFALLTLAILIEPLSHCFVVQGAGSDLFSLLLDKRNLVIGVGLALAVVDFFLAKPSAKPHNETSSRHNH